MFYSYSSKSRKSGKLNQSKSGKFNQSKDWIEVSLFKKDSTAETEIKSELNFRSQDIYTEASFITWKGNWDILKQGFCF